MYTAKKNTHTFVTCFKKNIFFFFFQFPKTIKNKLKAKWIKCGISQCKQRFTKFIECAYRNQPHHCGTEIPMLFFMIMVYYIALDGSGDHNQCQPSGYFVPHGQFPIGAFLIILIGHDLKQWYLTFDICEPDLKHTKNILFNELTD